MGDFIPYFTEKFTHAPLAVFLGLGLLSLYAIGEMVLVKRWDTLLDHLDTAAEVDSGHLKTTFFGFGCVLN